MKKNGIDVSKQKDKMIPVTDATIEQVGLGFESRMDELLERLKVTEVLAAKDEKVPDDIRAAVQFVAKRLAKVNEEIEVTPITKSLNIIMIMEMDGKLILSWRKNIIQRIV